MENSHNMITDLNTLTTIPEKNLTKLFKKIEAIICEAVVEDSLAASSDITEIDIGIGTLYIKHDTVDLKYKFKPSSSLANALVGSLTENKNPLADILTEALSTKFTDLYKDLC